jgi:hypothetical protein
VARVKSDSLLVEWLDTGWRVFKEGRRDAESFPPLSDMEAQRRVWLGAFGAARAAGHDDAGSVDAAIARALEARVELLRQLRSHRAG